MVYSSDLQYMRRELKFTLSTIKYIEKKYGDELTDSQRSRIMYLIKTLQELNIDVRYINQNPEILNCIDVYTDEEFLAIIEYIKKNAKKKTPNTILALIISAQQIIKNNRQNEVEQIIKLLEKESLVDLLENKEFNKKILQEGNYNTIRNNLQILGDLKTYRTIIRKNPEIILNTKTVDLKKIVAEIKEIEQKNHVTVDEEKNTDLDEKEIKENEKMDEYQENDELIDENQVLLGSEENVQKVIAALSKYNIPYNIIFINPEICRRKNIGDIDRILKILYDNNIPFNILDYSPQILQMGKSKTILEIITYIKSHNINLDILCVCPEILIKSNIKKIESVLTALEKEGINQHIIYSCPQILIAGSTKILIDMKNELDVTVPDLNIILDMAPYVFVEKVANMYSILDNDNYSDTVDRRYLSNSNRILVVRNVEESQKVIDVLKENKINLGIIKEEPKILTRATKRQANDVIDAIEKMGFDSKFIEQNPELIIYSSGLSIIETTTKLKEFRPLKYIDIINKQPEIYINSDSNKIENVMKIFEKQDLNYTVIDENPKILVRENEKEIGEVVEKLKEKGFTSKEIEKQPKILISGKSKYIDRNEEIIKRNKLKLPLSAVYTMKTRTLEKNIDTLIENGLYSYIEKDSKILELDPSKLKRTIALSKIYDIPLVKESKDDKDNKSINNEIFEMNTKELMHKYNIDEEVVKKVNSKIEKKRERKIKNVELYVQIYPILEKQANICLSEYEKDEVSYVKNSKIVSKQRLIRETYLDLEDAYEKKKANAIKEFNINEKLDKKLENLTKKKNRELKNEKIKIIEGKNSELIIEKGE